MKLFQGVKAAWSEFRNSLFDGATDTGTRTVVAWGSNAKTEIREWERKALVLKSRSLRNNLGLVGHMIQGVSDYSIGEGLAPQPQSADKEWNKQALAYFDGVVNHPNWNVTGDTSFYEDQALLLPEVMTDGEVFSLKVLGDFGEQNQLFTTDQLASDGWTTNTGWVDGIQYNSLGRALTYRVEQNSLPNTLQMRYTDVDRASMIHAFWKKRVHQRRGLPWLHHGVNSCLDILDLIAFEKVAAKLNSALIAAITTANGKLPASMDTLVEAMRKGATPTPPGEKPKPEEGMRALNIFGSSVPVLKGTEKIEFFENKRASLTFAGFIDYLIRDIAWGFGVAPELIWAISGLTGSNTRLVVELGDRYFRRVAGVLADAYCQPVYEWIIARACLNGDLPWPKDPAKRSWAQCKWRGPRTLTVDRGRDGRLYIELVKNRMMTLEEWWTLNNEDPAAMRRAWIDELAEDLAYCAEKGIDPAVYLNSQPGQHMAQQGDAQSGDQAAATARALLQMMQDEGLVMAA